MRKRNLLIFIILLGILLIGLWGIVLKRPKPPVLEKELNIFNWEDYLSEEVMKNFEEQYGVEVNLEIFEDSDFMFSAVQSQPDKYDLIVVEDDYLLLMKNLKLLAILDHGKIPNLRYLKPEAKENFYDPGNVYCVPYVNGYSGIAINTKYISGYDGERSILWDKKYQGKISMFNNSQEVLFNALIYLGYTDIDALTPEKLEEAIDLVLKQKDLVIGYDDPITQRELLINEEAWIAYIYTTEIAPIRKENPDIKFFAPKEGAFLWADNFCIPKDALHREASHAFLNYLLEPTVSAKNSQDIGALMVNGVMAEFLEPEFSQTMEGLDFPQEKEIYEKSRYYNAMVNIEIRAAVNRLDSELGMIEGE